MHKNHTSLKGTESSRHYSNRTYQVNDEYISTLYNQSFNSVMDSGYIPNSWLNGIKGDPKDPVYYRPY